MTENELTFRLEAVVTSRLSKFLKRILLPAQEAPEKCPQAATYQQTFVKPTLMA